MDSSKHHPVPVGAQHRQHTSAFKADTITNAFSGVNDKAWLDVIQKMDEVYTRLVADEIALEEKNNALERSQQFIYSLLTSMSDVLLACNTLGDIENTNAALSELTGHSEDSLRTKSVWQLLADTEQEKKLRQAIEHLRQKQRSSSVEVLLLDRQGQGVPVEFNCSIRRDTRHKYQGVVLVGRPLGELKQAYQQLNLAHTELQQAQQQLVHSEKMASLGRLVAGVAHELNNPISFILGNTHALDKYMKRLQQYWQAEQDDSHSAQDLKRLRQTLRIDKIMAELSSITQGMMEGAERSTTIVNGLKRFSAVDGGGSDRVDLVALVKQALHWTQKGTAPSFQVYFQAQNSAWVIGNSGQLLQVLINLIQNAYDASYSTQKEHAKLAISLQIDGKTSAQDRNIKLFFSDNGPGIAPENWGKVFDPFFTTKPVGQGTGLGLSISYGIVEQHGGSLSVKNKEQGDGAVFVLTLPLSL